MAKFNSKARLDNESSREECGMYLQECLSEYDYEELFFDWNNAGGLGVIPYCEYCFDNIKVVYSKEELMRVVDGCYCEDCANINTSECIAAFYSEDDGKYWTPDEIRFCGYGKRKFPY